MSDFSADFLKAVSEKNFEDIEKLFPLASEHALRLYMTGDEFTPLHNANSAGMVQYCISSGLDVDFLNPETDETPLLIAVKLNKFPSVIRELLKQGASIEVRNKHTLNTPLNQAVHRVNCRPENVLALLEHGADANTVNKYGVTPLHKACENYTSDVRIVEKLLRCGAAVDRENSDGLAPLSIALRNPRCTAELVNLLLKFKAVVTPANIGTALRVDHSNKRNIIEPLIEHACFTGAKDWKSVLRDVFVQLEERQIGNCGMLVIKHSFLQCGDPHDALVSFLHSYQKRGNELLIQSDRNIYSSSRERFLSVFHALIPQLNGLDQIDPLKSFADDCSSEIGLMKEEILSNDTSVYEIVSSKTQKVCPDNKLLHVLCKNSFPIYCDILFNKVKRPFLLNKLLSQEIYTSAQHGDIAKRVVLDSLSVSYIAKYLDGEDLNNLADAFCKPSTRKGCVWDKLVEIEARLSKKRQKMS